MALLPGTRLEIPSSGRGLKSGGFSGYAHDGGSSAPDVGAAPEKMNASARARSSMNVLMFSSRRLPWKTTWPTPATRLVVLQLGRASLCGSAAVKGHQSVIGSLSRSRGGGREEDAMSTQFWSRREVLKGVSASARVVAHPRPAAAQAVKWSAGTATPKLKAPANATACHHHIYNTKDPVVLQATLRR